MRVLLIFLLLVSGCSHYSAKKYSKLFPYGTYKHLIEIKSEKEKFSFQGLNRSSPDELIVAVLGGFDVTILKCRENYSTGEKEIYFDKNIIPMSEEKLFLYLSVFKKIYELDKSICEKNTCHERIYGQDLFFDFNEKGEVSLIRITRGKTKAKIKVVEYEKLP